MGQKNLQDCFKYKLTDYTYALKKLVNVLKTIYSYFK